MKTVSLLLCSAPVTTALATSLDNLQPHSRISVLVFQASSVPGLGLTNEFTEAPNGEKTCQLFDWTNVVDTENLCPIPHIGTAGKGSAYGVFFLQ